MLFDRKVELFEPTTDPFGATVSAWLNALRQHCVKFCPPSRGLLPRGASNPLSRGNAAMRFVKLPLT